MKKLDPIGITLLTTKVRKLLADCVQFRADGGASATDPILGPIGETYLADLCDVVDALRADDNRAHGIWGYPETIRREAYNADFTFGLFEQSRALRRKNEELKKALREAAKWCPDCGGASVVHKLVMDTRGIDPDIRMSSSCPRCSSLIAALGISPAEGSGDAEKEVLRLAEGLRNVAWEMCDLHPQMTRLKEWIDAYDAAIQAVQPTTSEMPASDGTKSTKEIDRLTGELAELRGEVREWVCEKCNIVYPGPPSKSFTCVRCPRCGGVTMPKTLFSKRQLSAALAKLTAELVAVRQQMADKEAAGYAVVELWEKRTDHLRDENIKLRKAIGKARRLAFAMRMKAMVCDEVLCNTGADVDEGN